MPYRITLAGKQTIETDTIAELHALLLALKEDTADLYSPPITPAKISEASAIAPGPGSRAAQLKPKQPVVSTSTKPTRARTAARRDALLAALAEEPQSPAALADAAKTSVQLVRYHLAPLIEAGTVIASGATTQRRYARAPQRKTAQTPTAVGPASRADNFETVWNGAKDRAR